MVRLLIIFFLLQGFSNALFATPIGRDDLKGLGNSKVAAILRDSVFLGEDTTERAVFRLVNAPEIIARPDKVNALTELGFICQEQKKICHYHGIAKTSVIGEGDTISRDITIDVKLTAFIQSDRIHIKSDFAGTENHNEESLK